MDNYDLIVIGGGILGTFHAYHAVKAGKKVLLLEKDNYPVGATVRNFGQIVPSGMAGKWFDYGARGLEIYQSIQKEFDISVRQNGSVYIASDQDEQTLIHELKAHYDTKGYPSMLLSSKDISERYAAIRSTYAREAIFFPQEISVEPRLMIHRLQQYLRERHPSFSIRYNTAAVNCHTAHSRVLVTVTGGTSFEAGMVIICNGYEFKLLYPEIFRESGLVISKLQMMRTIPFPDTRLEGNILTGMTIRRYESFETHCPSFSSIPVPGHYAELKKWGIHILFKKAPDGSVIIGDSHEYADVAHFDDLGYTVRQPVNELMLAEAERIVHFDVRRIADTWAGYYPQHNEKQIVEHDIDEYIHIRTGIGGKGMTASAGYAEESVGKLM